MALTLEEFLPKARQLNPDYTDDEHIQAYEQRYGRSKPVQTVSPAPLTTFEQFLPKARALNPDYSDEEHYAAWQEKYGARGAREKDQGDFVRGGVTAFKQIPQTIRGLEAGAGAIGEKIAGEGGLFTALKEHGLKGYQEHAADIAKDSKSSDSVTDAYKMAKAGDAGALVDWLQYALGYGGGQALQMLATAGVGYAGGKMALQPAAKVVAEKMIAKESARLAATGMAGAQLAKQAVSNVAGKIGQIGAIGATAVGMEGGEIYGGLVEKAAAEGRSLTGEELAKAAGATLGAGILEFVGDKIGLDLILGKSVAGKLVSSRLGHAVGAGSLGVATEGGTEFTQTLVEEFGKGNDPLAPESIKQAVDAAAMGGVGGASMGAAGGLLSRPQGRDGQPIVTERTQEEMGLAQPIPRQIEGPIQPGEVRRGTVYAPGEVVDVTPLPDVSPIVNAGSLDEAIANAVGVVQGATETGKRRAAEFARMTAKAKNETDALLANAPEKRSGSEVPIIQGSSELLPQTSENIPKIIPGQAFTPRPEPVDDPRTRLAEERSRMVAQREQQRLTQPVNPVSEPVAPTPSVEPADTPLPSQIDLAYPSSKQVRDLIHEKGFHLDTPVFQEILKQTVGKQKFSDLTPQELQTLAEKVQKIKAPQSPTQTQEAPPQVPLTPTEPTERPYAPVTTIPEAQVPRSELTPEKNAEMLLRAEKAKADLEVAGKETGRRKVFTDNANEPGQTVTGLASAAPEWYTELQSGPGKVSADYKTVNGKRVQTKTARQKIEEAIQKIIKDEGADRGKAVEQVKAALLADTEFHKTEWGRDLNSIMQGEWPSWIEKPQGVTQATENAKEFQNVPQGTSQATVEEPKPKKVPLSRTERLAQQKQKMDGKKRPQDEPVFTFTIHPARNAPMSFDEFLQRSRFYRSGPHKMVEVPGGQKFIAKGEATAGNFREVSRNTIQRMHDSYMAKGNSQKPEIPKQPEPSPSNAPAMESQPATASPEREPAPPTSEAAPTTEEPFSLSSPDVAKPKAKDAGPEQLSIAVPPPTSGERPIIGREATLAEAPLFSKAAQEKDPEQISLDRATIPTMATDRGPGSSPDAQQPPEPGRTKEGSPEWAQSLYDLREIPPGWYAHGRHNGKNLETGHVLYLTKNLDVADWYSGKNGSVWYVRPKDNAEVLDLSDSSGVDMDRVVERALYDFENGTLPFVDDIEQSFGRYASRDDIESAVRSEFSPQKLEPTGQAFDNNKWHEWFRDRFDDVDVVKTNDGAIVLSTKSIDSVKIPNSSSPQQGGLSSVTPAKATASEPLEKTDESPVIPNQNAGSSKEPWEMTRDEFLSSPDGFKMSPAERLLGKRFQTSTDKDRAETYHKFNIIGPALREGKPVPPEVLADYPDLQQVAEELSGRAKEDFTDYKPVLERQVSAVTGPNNKALAVVSVLTGIHPKAQQALVDHLKMFDPSAYAALHERNQAYPERAIGKTEAPQPKAEAPAQSPTEILADALRTAADKIEGRNKEPKAKDGNLTDVGEELWYNKRNRAGKGIIWNDVKDLNATLKVKEVTKTRVWPRPDYEQLVEDGMHPFTAHLVKQIYDSIATAPSTNSPTDDKLQAYIETVQKLREAVFSWAKNLQQQRDLLDNMVGQAGAERSAQTFGSPVQISSLMKSTDYSIIRQVWPSPEGIGAFRDQKNKESLWLVGGNKLFGALQPGYDEAKRAIAALKEGWPAQQEAWQKRFTIKEVPVGEKIYSREGARTLTEPEFWIMRKSKASRFGNIVETGLRTREEAVEKAKSLAERKEKDGGEEEIPLNLEGLQRVGVERRAKGENISPAAFKDAFGFRGVNFGNWTNQAERQAHVNLAYDALMDLADVLGIPPKALSLDGLLGVAFGAQGSGKYAAHFVPGVNEINLTKTRGAGALAHEWAHAVDHYFAAQAGEKYAKSTDPFLTHLSQVQSATIRAEVVDAFKTIVKTMKQRDQTAEEIKQGYSEKLARAEKGLRSWTDTIEKRIPEEKRGPVSKLIERIKMGDVGDGYVKAGRDSAFRTRIHELREAYKVAMGHLLPKEEAQAIQNWGNSLEFARKAQSPQGHIPQKSTNYLVNAEKFDKDKGGKQYWTQPTELFARAFQSYVMDRLEAKAERNDYLTRPQKEDSPAYPQGEERTAINAAFDKLVDTIQTKETDKGIALYQKRTERRAAGQENPLNGLTLDEALATLQRDAPTDGHKQVAATLAKRINELRDAGLKFNLQAGDRNGELSEGVLGSVEWNPHTLTATIRLGGTNAYWHETGLHEFVHATTMVALEIGADHSGTDSVYAKLRSDLDEIFEAVREHLAARGMTGEDLTPFEQQVYDGMNNALDNPHEMLAWGMTSHEMQNLLDAIPSTNGKTWWEKFVEAIRSFFGLPNSSRTALSDMLRTATGLFSAPVDELVGLINDESQSFTADQIRSTSTINPTEVRDRLAAVKTSVRPYLLGALGLEQLSQVYGNDHAEVKAYNQATQAMEADFTEMSRESDKIARAWTDLKIPVADKMAQVMEDARFLNFDPDPERGKSVGGKKRGPTDDIGIQYGIDGKPDELSQKKQKLRERFDQLPDDAKAVYRMARDYYTKMFKDRLKAIKERVQRAGGAQTQKLLDEFSLDYNKALGHVYFPSTRFGDYVVYARKMENGKEVDRYVHTFESVAEAQKLATMMRLKGWKVKETVAKEFSQDRQNAASEMVKKLAAIIDTMDSSPSLPEVGNWKEELLDHLNQTYLHSLPDLSYSKHFIHARNVKGASRDALRAFAHSALHGAHHISRIRHADKVTNALVELDDKIKKTEEGNVHEARQVYNELVKRHNDIMNPNTHPFSAWLGQLGFTMSLGGVVATGITNATQVPLVTYPWMGARYGFGKASAALARAYRDFLDPRTLNKDSLFDATKSKLISESERKMLLELARRGHIDLTQTMDLAGLSSRDNLSRKARTLGTVGEKVTRMLGFTFHAPEVMNRQVTALATFRLEKAKDGATYESALEKAEQAIKDTHFIYQSFNRARYMQGNFLRVLTMFKQYSQNIAYTYGRAASIWLDRNNATKEERGVAKRQLLSMLALQFGAAGALGMPFFGAPLDLLMAVVSAMGGDDDEKRDWEVSLRKWLDGTATSLAEAFIDDKEQAGKVGKELAEVVAHGASRLTPWDMAGRLGQNDLFFREPQREREGRQAVMDWMLSLGGPVPGYGVNFLLGLGDVAKGITELNAGFFMRGVEELTPAVLRNGVKSLRYTLEGVRTRDEYKQLDLDTSEKLGQLFGFTPARVAEMYESTTAVKNKEHRILNEQKSLKDRFARAVDDQDDNAKQRILEDIRGFNERNPMFAITSNTLNRSIKTRRQHEAGMERGMYLPPRRRALMDEGDFGDF